MFAERKNHYNKSIPMNSEPFLVRLEKLLNDSNVKLINLDTLIARLEKVNADNLSKKLEIIFCCAELHIMNKSHDKALEKYYEILKSIQNLEFNYVFYSFSPESQKHLRHMMAVAIQNLILIYLQNGDTFCHQEKFNEALLSYTNAKQLISLFGNYGDLKGLTEIINEVENKMAALPKETIEIKAFPLFALR